MKKTITVEEETWKKLAIRKIEDGYDTLDELIRDLMRSRPGKR